MERKQSLNKILVIGGSNVDYLAKSDSRLIFEDSNIGTVRLSHGGVGRNIAENLARLKARVTFLTALSSDSRGCEMRKELERLGVKVYSPLSLKPSASYVAIQSPEGDMALAVADTAIMSDLTTDWIDNNQKLFDEASFLVFDANLSFAKLQHLFMVNAGRPIAVDAISTKKAQRFAPFLNQLTLFKGNIYEGAELAGTTDPLAILDFFLLKGVQNVVISTGDGPIYYANHNTRAKLPILPSTNIVSTTGCGDALFAGIVKMLADGKSLIEGVKLGRLLAFHTLSSAQAVAPDLNDWLSKQDKSINHI